MYHCIGFNVYVVLQLPNDSSTYVLAQGKVTKAITTETAYSVTIEYEVSVGNNTYKLYDSFVFQSGYEALTQLRKCNNVQTNEG